MPLDAGVPDRHCGVASRAISSAMVDHRSILLVHWSECIALGNSDGKWLNCEGRLVMQFARYFLYFQLYLYLAYISPGFLLIYLY